MPCRSTSRAVRPGSVKLRLRLDRARQRRGELQAPFDLSFAGGAAVASPYLFGAAGFFDIVDPTAVEASFVCAASYGLGVRLGSAPTASFTNANLMLEWSRAEASETDDRFLVTGGLK